MFVGVGEVSQDGEQRPDEGIGTIVGLEGFDGAGNSKGEMLQSSPTITPELRFIIDDEEASLSIWADGSFLVSN